MGSTQWRDGLPLKIINVIVYLLLLGSNIYTVAYSQADSIKQTYLTPANWAFFAWPIIHFLLLGTAIYQFTSSHAKAVVIDGISWWFPLLTILNILSATARANHYHTTAFDFSLLVSSTAGHIYSIIKRDHPPKFIGDYLFVHLPFSLWHEWATFLRFLTAFEAFGVDASKDHAGIWTKFFVLLTL